MAIKIKTDDPRLLRERRNLVSLFMVTALLGVALQEAVVPVREAVRGSGVTLTSFALFTVFFLTLFRFFIGNLLHLQSPDLTNRSSGLRWLFDLFVIVIECIIMIFAAGLATLAANSSARLGFFDLMVLLYVVDVGWVLAMAAVSSVSRLHVLGRLAPRLARQYVPYRWALLNGAVAVYVVASGFLAESHTFTDRELGVLVGVNVVAFILDVLVFDYDDIV